MTKMTGGQGKWKTEIQVLGKNFSNGLKNDIRLHCENIFKIACAIQRVVGNKSHDLTCCSLLQPMVVYNFGEIESNFSAPV